MAVPKEVYVKKLKEFEGFKIGALFIVAFLVIIMLIIIVVIASFIPFLIPIVYPFAVVAAGTLIVGVFISSIIYTYTYIKTPSK